MNMSTEQHKAATLAELQSEHDEKKAIVDKHDAAIAYYEKEIQERGAASAQAEAEAMEHVRAHGNELPHSVPGVVVHHGQAVLSPVDRHQAARRSLRDAERALVQLRFKEREIAPLRGRIAELRRLLSAEGALAAAIEPAREARAALAAAAATLGQCTETVANLDRMLADASADQQAARAAAAAELLAAAKHGAAHVAASTGQTERLAALELARATATEELESARQAHRAAEASDASARASLQLAQSAVFALHALVADRAARAASAEARLATARALRDSTVQAAEQVLAETA